jgi:hypothetical protein
MDRGRVGEDRGSKETDGCPLTNTCRSGAFPTMVEEDKDESPHENIDETDKEAQDTCPAFDDDLTIEKGDHIFIAMVHSVNPHHFAHASSMVSGCLVEVFAKNSRPKGFQDIMPMLLHAYANVFSEMAFDSLPEHHK